MPPARSTRSHAAGGSAAPRRAPWKTWAVRGITLAFFVLVLFVLARMARKMDWQVVLATLAGYRAGTLALAIGLAACSYLVYAGYELLARRYSGHRLPPTLTALIGVLAYAFNLSLGAWLGGIGFRYRLYSERGVEAGTTAQVYLSVLLTNWSGYVAVAGVAFSVGSLTLPAGWELGHRGLQGLGVLALVAAAAFLVACARLAGRHLEVRGHEFDLPGPGLAAAQMALGAANWLLMAGIIHSLLPRGQIGYGTVLAALLVAAVAGAITHIPGALGVLEAVFLAVLSDRLPESELLGALVAYRAVYFIGPLLLAAVVYLGLEAATTRRLPAARVTAR